MNNRALKGTIEERRHREPDTPTRETEPMAYKPSLMTTTLWDFPSQQYGDEKQGDPDYVGATPAYIVWNLLQRYTRPGDLVADPMAGSGTTLDVARDLGRRSACFDLQSSRQGVERADARRLPLADETADFVFVDPPYSTHVDYGPDPACIGKLDAAGPEYYEAMARVVAEIDRVLKPGRHMALYVCDSFRKGKPLHPIGFELFSILRRHFEVVEIVAVVRRNRALLRRHHHAAAEEGNYFLRGFNYLFIMRKPETKVGAGGRSGGDKPVGRDKPRRTTKAPNAASPKERPADRKRTEKPWYDRFASKKRGKKPGAA